MIETWNGNKILFKTLVGSWQFNMQRLDSDKDYFICYVANSDDILLGKNVMKSESITKPNNQNIDIATHEIGNVIRELEKGNINYILGLTGKPEITTPEHEKLLNYVVSHPTKNIYHSIHGLVVQNYKKYILFKIDASQKRLGTIYRLLLFGINYLKDGTIMFEKPEGNIKPEYIKQQLSVLDNMYLISTLPEKNSSEWYDKFLLKIRKELLVE
jgi:predicted nucleotidyltransferase